jgi:hypothetical protein
VYRQVFIYPKGCFQTKPGRGQSRIGGQQKGQARAGGQQKGQARAGGQQKGQARAGGRDYITAGMGDGYGTAEHKLMGYDRHTHRKHSSSKEKLLSLFSSVNQGLNVIKI